MAVGLSPVFRAFSKARKTGDKPTAIIAKTHKGCGVYYMTDQAGWHGKAPNDEEFEIAMKELSAEAKALGEEGEK